MIGLNNPPQTGTVEALAAAANPASQFQQYLNMIQNAVGGQQNIPSLVQQYTPIAQNAIENLYGGSYNHLGVGGDDSSLAKARRLTGWSDMVNSFLWNMIQGTMGQNQAMLGSLPRPQGGGGGGNVTSLDALLGGAGPTAYKPPATPGQSPPPYTTGTGGSDTYWNPPDNTPAGPAFGQGYSPYSDPAYFPQPHTPTVAGIAPGTNVDQYGQSKVLRVPRKPRYE